MSHHGDSRRTHDEWRLDVVPLGRAANVSVAGITLATDTSVPEHYHRRSDEVFICIAGEGELRVDRGRIGLTPGQTAVVPALSRHSLINGSSTPLSVLVVSAPPYRDDDSYQD